MTDISPFIQKMIEKYQFTKSESYAFFNYFSKANATQQAAALALLANNEITVPQLNGALQYFFEQVKKIKSPYPVLDIVGTGGDGLGTFNISTAASIVVASSGIFVAKHGGRASTSKSGSVDVIEQLEIPLYDDPHLLLSSLEKYHYAYLCAPYFNPLMKSLGPLRRSLGFQTILNILGPLSNPMSPSSMVVGVFRKDLVPIIAEVLLEAGKEQALIVHSEEGLDEFSISGISHVAHLNNGLIKEFTITPEKVGLTSSPLKEVIGGTPAENANIIRGILSGEITGAKLNIVLLNAAAGFVVAKRAENLAQGVILSRNAIESGKAYLLLNNLKNGVSNEHFRSDP